MLRELLTDHPESVAWPDSLTARARHPRLRPRGARRAVPRPREGARRRRPARCSARPRGCRSSWPPGCSSTQYLDSLDNQGAIDYADLIRRAAIEAEEHRDELRGRLRHVFVDEYQDTDPGQVALLRALAGDGRDLIVVGDPHQSIYGFRGADVRGILDFPTEFPRADGAPGRRRRAAHDPPLRLPAAASPPSGSPPGWRCPARSRSRRGRRSSTRRPAPDSAGRRPGGRCAPSTPSAPRPSTSPTCCAAPTSRTASRWAEMAVLVRSGRTSIPPLRRALGAAGVPVEVASDEMPLVRDPAVLPLLDALRRRRQPRQHRPRPRRLRRRRPRRGAAARPARRARRRRRTPARPALRAREKEQSKAEERAPRTSRELVRAPSSSPAASTGSRAPEVGRARALAQLLVDARADLGRRRHGRGGALDALVAHRLAGPAAPGRRPRRRRRPPRPPRPRLDLRAVRGRRPGRGAARPRRRPRVPRRRCVPSRSPPTRSPTGASAATPYAC